MGNKTKRTHFFTVKPIVLFMGILTISNLNYTIWYYGRDSNPRRNFIPYILERDAT